MSISKCRTTYFATCAFLALCVMTNSGYTLAAKRGDLIRGGFDSNSRAQRLEIAKEVLSSVETLAQYLPTLKPSEKTWIDEERLAIDNLGDSKAASSRLRTWYESPEVQHERLATALTEITNALHCVIDGTPPLRREIVCWAVASSNLTDSTTLDTAIGILLKSGRLPKKPLSEYFFWEGPDYTNNWRWYGRGMLQYLVVPYLQGNITQ